MSSKRKEAPIIPSPSVEQLELYLKKWSSDENENYKEQEKALNKLFFELFPTNTDLTEILIKVATLNDFYYTNIFSVYTVAKHIFDLDIDKRLNDGDLTLVDDLKSVKIGNSQRNFYSFATKYCSHHFPEYFPIYDKYVEKILLYFKKRDDFSSFKAEDLKKYDRFLAVLLDFQKFYGLSEYTLKELDKYLWQLGKEFFKKY